MPTTLDVKSKRAIGNSHRAIPRLRLDGTLERASMEGRFLAVRPDLLTTLQRFGWILGFPACGSRLGTRLMSAIRSGILL
jgi:hypothetical protein